MGRASAANAAVKQVPHEGIRLHPPMFNASPNASYYMTSRADHAQISGIALSGVRLPYGQHAFTPLAL